MKSPLVRQVNRRFFGPRNLFSYLISLCPVGVIAFYLYNIGSNNISNDNLLIQPLLDKILNGSCEWANFFRDVYFNDHFQLFSILTQWFVAKFFNLNVYVILWIGLSLAVFKLFFFYFAITCHSESKGKNYWLVPLSFLVFSPSQIPTFESDWNTVMVGLTQAGVSVGLWGLVRFRPMRTGVWFMALGGIFASFSSGMGPLAWPAFLVSMTLLKYSRVSDYLVWFLSAALGSFPYLYFRVLSPVVRPYDNPKILHSLQNYRLVLEALGWPFKQGMSAELSYLAGWVGIVLLVVALLLISFRRKQGSTLEAIAAPLMLVVWGLLTAVVVAVFRGGLTPWYAAFFMPFWIGLLGLAYVLWNDRSMASQAISNSWALTLLLFMSFLYFGSVSSFNENRFFVKQRSPVAASCLRAFETAPTYCAEKLFSWDLQHYEEYVEYAELLKKNRLSVFSDSQVWTLQGDYVLGTVKLVEGPGLPKAFWTPDLSNRSETFFAPERLNLFLHSPNSVEWELTLPSDLESAILNTAFAFNEAAPSSGDPDGATFSIVVSLEDGSSVTLVSQYILPNQRAWIPVQVPLTRFAGKKVVLRIGSDGLDNITHDWAMYRHPYLEIRTSARMSENQSGADAMPENTELSPRYQGHRGGEFSFPGFCEQWTFHGVEIVGSSDPSAFRVTGQDPWMEYKGPLGLELGKYFRFFLKISVQEKSIPRYVQIYYKLNGQNSFEEKHSFKIPLLKDQQMHEYSYDIKLLELGAGDILTGIRIDPVPDARGGLGSSFSISNIGIGF